MSDWSIEVVENGYVLIDRFSRRRVFESKKALLEFLDVHLVVRPAS